MAIVSTAILFFLLGIMSLFGYAFWRGRKKTWDDSNLVNPLRFYAHVILHPDDFEKMYYSDGRKPFWYLSKDEFSEVVKTRRPEESVWHEVSRMLPEERKFVLCACGDKEYRYHVLYLEKYEDKLYWYDCNNVLYAPVVAWIELPNYKSEI